MVRVRPSAWAAMLLAAMAAPAWGLCARTCARRPGGCARGFGTLAYVMSTCRVVGQAQVGSQELRVQRSGCDPVTVMRFEDPTPVADPLGLCALVGRNHLGTASPIAGVFQRLGVSETGKSVVFEVSNAFDLVEQPPLAPEEQGFFYVRSDGRGLRRLGPPSRDRTYRAFVSGGVPAATITTRIAFAGDRRMAFTDLAPGPDGVETEQLFTMDLATAERRQATQLVAGTPPKPGRRIIEYFRFTRPRTIGFVHRQGDELDSERVDIDGSGHVVDAAPPSPTGDGRVVPTIQPTRLRYQIFNVAAPGLPVNARELPDYGPNDLFAEFNDHNFVQLTNYRYGDTALIGERPNAVLFETSADPVGENPFHNCQLFRISPHGLGLRQLTRFDQGRHSDEGCQIGPLAGCGINPVNETPESDSSPAIAFYSDCDPLGTNPNGSQVFALRWNGSGLRQLTNTRGVTTGPDGSVVEVEIPGPVARGGPR